MCPPFSVHLNLSLRCLRFGLTGGLVLPDKAGDRPLYHRFPLKACPRLDRGRGMIPGDSALAISNIVRNVIRYISLCDDRAGMSLSTIVTI